MKHFQLALQLFSVRDDVAADFAGTLRRVRSFGYDGVEFAGLYGHSAADVRQMCGETGLVPISAHVAYAEMLEHPEVFAAYRDIGCRFIVIPWLDRELLLPGTPENETLLKNVRMLGERAHEYGMQLCYHNHDFEFEAAEDGIRLEDHLLQAVPRDLLWPQFDTCWVKVGGGDPAAYIRQYTGRGGIVHLKDFVGGKTQNMYELIGRDDVKAEAPATAFELRPVGCGCQNFPEILQASREVGASWMVVEQDTPSMGKTPMECAEIGAKYLNAL